MDIRSIFIFCFLYETATSSYCYWNSGCPYKYFSTKTPYNNVRGDIRDSVVKLKDCEPISIWAIISNGKCFPNDFKKMFSDSLTLRDHVISSYKNRTSSLCAQDVEYLQNWKLDDIILNKSKFVSAEGSQELTGIANRLHQTFPKLLQNLQEGSYKISSSSNELELDSAKIFTERLKNEPLDIDTNSLFAPRRTCNKYQELVKLSPSFVEINKYKKTPDYYTVRNGKTKDRIQRRLGIEYELSDESIKSLYNLCRYSWSGIENKFSPWCALFTTEDLRVLEYMEDLEQYYLNGYGSPISEPFGQILLSDLVENFDAARDGKGKAAVVHFSDIDSLSMVCTALNLFKDESTLSGTKRDPKRKWRTSKISVFSSNVMAVLNRCENKGKHDYNVILYLNEQPLRICENGYCTWNEFHNEIIRLSNKTIDDVC